jgi:glycosyltransferase involved in cell wall biosynthesis
VVARRLPAASALGLVSGMRITFIAPRSWPSVGGAQSFLRHLTCALAERHDVRVLALSVGDERPHRLWESVLPPNAFDSFTDEGVLVEHLRLPPARRALLAPLAAQAVPGLRRYAYGRARRVNVELYARTIAPLIARRAAGTDVLHMWGTGLLGAAAVRAAGLLDVPCAITPFAHRGQWGDDAASAETYKRADTVLSLLEADAQLYRELGVTQVAVGGVCSPGVEAGGGEELRRRHGIEGPLVLFLGRRTAYKGVDLLLEAAPLAHRATFAFVGPGDAVSGERIVDAGAVDDRERAAWLDAADVLCLPSAAEIFPVSILEAWSVGTPVLTSDIAPLRELVDGSGGGIVVERDAAAIATALRTLLDDERLLRLMGNAGRSSWRNAYSVGAVRARHERVYDELRREESTCAA